MKDHITLKGILLLTLLISLIAMNLSCQDKTESPGSMIKREPLNIGIALQPNSALFIIANEKGFFEKHGLDIIAKEYPSGKRAMLEGLLTGEADVVSTADVPIVFNSFKRKDFSIITATCAVHNMPRIVARKDSGIIRPSDLLNKRLATQKASAVHFFLHNFLINIGLSEDDIELLFMKAEELPSALASGEIDAFSMREPYVSEAVKLLGDNAVIFEAPEIYSVTDYVVASNKLVEERPGAIIKITKALQEAENFYRTHKEESFRIVSGKLGTPVSEISRILSFAHIEVSITQANLIGLESIARWAIKSVLTDEQMVPNYLDYIYRDALLEINPEALSIY